MSGGQQQLTTVSRRSFLSFCVCLCVCVLSCLVLDEPSPVICTWALTHSGGKTTQTQTECPGIGGCRSKPRTAFSSGRVCSTARYWAAGKPANWAVECELGRWRGFEIYSAESPRFGETAGKRAL